MPVTSEIYYHLYEGSPEGQRPPVVLLHGAGGNHLFWPSELRRLAGYRIYALDLQGHGKSAGRGLQSIEAYASAVRDWLAEIGLHSAVIVGHSMGSAIALSMALEHPEHVLGLGLFGAAARLRVAADLLDNASNATTLQNAVTMIVSRSFSPSAPPAFVTLAGQRFAETRASVLYGDLLACDAFDVSDQLGKVTSPALVVVGAEDQMTPARHAHLLAASLPVATLKVIPDAGHMVMLEKPGEAASALTEFLAGITYY